MTDPMWRRIAEGSRQKIVTRPGQGGDQTDAADLPVRSRYSAEMPHRAPATMRHSDGNP
jgi:hypothetical protein